ncbi:oxidoreductase [Dactylosporangium sp. AC04546]|uniref:oxidoreductase n=1 Tax=Dactylosporangium sp. AC04546 TaxID=2862460 RepID=UPI001EDE186F|nr:oxidoreductase [Dactylosporangium sp. AC04546]WVK84650.1 oxidoreductase [Dactylosporangium sp. AC04546]
MRWTTEQIADQRGKTFLVTGASSGLGLVTARVLADKGAHVIMAVRDLEKGRRAARSGSVELKRVDLADLDTVRALAEDLQGRTIDVLINNAGVMMPPRRLSAQGHELQFAANHLGHFALTLLLLDRITDRVVTVSSTRHRTGRIHYDDLDGAKGYSPMGFYSQSKFANVLFGLELHRRLRAAGDPRKSVLAHPGWSNTNLQTAVTSGPTKIAMRIANALFAQPMERGALDQLYAATDPRVESGQFIGPDGPGEHRGWPTVVQPVKPAQDEQDAKRLWDLSERLTGVQLSSADLRRQRQ